MRAVGQAGGRPGAVPAAVRARALAGGTAAADCAAAHAARIERRRRRDGTAGNRWRRRTRPAALAAAATGWRREGLAPARRLPARCRCGRPRVHRRIRRTARSPEIGVEARTGEPRRRLAPLATVAAPEAAPRVVVLPAVRALVLTRANEATVSAAVPTATTETAVVLTRLDEATISAVRPARTTEAGLRAGPRQATATATRRDRLRRPAVDAHDRVVRDPFDAVVVGGAEVATVPAAQHRVRHAAMVEQHRAQPAGAEVALTHEDELIDHRHVGCERR